MSTKHGITSQNRFTKLTDRRRHHTCKHPVTNVLRPDYTHSGGNAINFKHQDIGHYQANFGKVNRHTRILSN